MLVKLLSFFGTFAISVAISAICEAPRPSLGPESKSVLPCEAQKEKEVFSRKHYFSKDESRPLLGKRVRNLNCGKIKCPVRSNNCSGVAVGETGRIISLKPRDGFDDFTLIVDWDEPRKLRGSSFVEQGTGSFISYLGNDGSYQILD